MKTIIILLVAVTASFATFAQTGKSKKETSKASTIPLVKYTCPMDTDVVSYKPGKCPKCGMDMTKVKTYTCPMHPEVASEKPGKCPKCDMDLIEVKPKAKKRGMTSK